MKLLVILLCLLSERFLVHAVSYTRFHWFAAYFHQIQLYLGERNSAALLSAVILPPVIVVGLILYLLSPLLFGLIGFILHVMVFYYCIGPVNPFYPIKDPEAEDYSEQVVGNYFVKVNEQLFAVIFWYIVLGPIGALFYRLASLSQEQEATAQPARVLMSYLDWLPARITVFLFLLVGNFQRGLHFFKQQVLSSPQNNEALLREGGLLAARTNESEPVQLAYAENIVEHALVVFLVFLALFTLVALM